MTLEMSIYRYLLVFFLCCTHFPSFSDPVAKKIVSLAPNLTEIVYALGLGERLVGNTTDCDFPPEAGQIYKVGGYKTGISLERVLLSGADTVLATDGIPPGLLKRMTSHGLHVVEVHPHHPRDVPQMINDIGRELGVPKKGEILAQALTNAMKRLSSFPHQKLTFLLVLQLDPVYSAGPNTWLGGLVSMKGWNNIIPKGAVDYPVIAPEFLASHVPDVILVDPMAVNARDIKEVEEELLLKISLSTAKKLKKTPRVIVLPRDVFVRPGPRLQTAITFLERL